jgi:DNA adenine methylase
MPTVLDSRSEMPVTAIAPWFGGKRTLAPAIVAELGPHRAYWEPFCGSMAVLMAKAPASMETVNDLHGDLVNLARVIRDDRLGAVLYRRLRRTLLSRNLFEESAAVIRVAPGPDAVDVDRAYHWFVVSWFGRNGVAGTANYNAGFCVRYTANGGHAAKRFASAVESIPAWRRRMRGVTILSDDGLELVDRIEDSPGTAIYCDPPYLVKGARYVHDFADKDHVRLATLLRRFRRARVVVSYYDHPRLAGLYPGWTKRTFEVSKAMAHQGRRGGNDTRAVEVLLFNGPSHAGIGAGRPLFAGDGT